MFTIECFFCTTIEGFISLESEKMTFGCEQSIIMITDLINNFWVLSKTYFFCFVTCMILFQNLTNVLHEGLKWSEHQSSNALIPILIEPNPNHKSAISPFHWLKTKVFEKPLHDGSNDISSYILIQFLTCNIHFRYGLTSTAVGSKRQYNSYPVWN